MVGVTTIVSLALIGVGAVAVMSLRDEAMRLTDSKVSDSLAAFSYSYIKRDAAGVATGELTAFQGQALGTVIAVLRGDSVVYATVFGDGEPKAAPADAQRALEGLDLMSGAAAPLDRMRRDMELLSCRACHVLDGVGGPPEELVEHWPPNWRATRFATPRIRWFWRRCSSRTP